MRPYLVDGLGRRQRAGLAVIIATWLGLSAWAWRWFIDIGPTHHPAAFAVNLAFLLFDALLLPAWFYAWVWRMREPDPNLQPLPELRVAMVVTKAPMEPWSVVRRTLEGMLAQDYPYPYDCWLADEQVGEETAQWCKANGVMVSTREGVADYHRPNWPRRTKCKEGNMAYFYDHWGYELYDVVAQFDADHVPESGYLRRILPPFVDSEVGYVAAPSVCDLNAGESWAARGRLYAEAMLHGPIQAGSNGPSCIGSHYAVRTCALKEVGGLGPTLSEDFSTTMIMQGSGWKGVFAPQAEAHGLGPATVGDCLTQEYQWSRSMTNVLMRVLPQYKEKMPRGVRARLTLCVFWYPLYSVTMLMSVVIPVFALFTGIAPMTVTLGGFYLHFAMPVLALVVTAWYLRRLGWLRPADAKVVAWETILFQMIRWPWSMLGVSHASISNWTGYEFNFQVTPKGQGSKPISIKTIWPYMAISAFSALPLAMGVQGGTAHGYAVLAAANVVIYSTATMAMTVLHYREQGFRLGRLYRRVAMAVVSAMAVLLVVGCASTGALAALEPAVTPHALQLGVNTQDAATNEFRPWTGGLGDVRSFERLTKSHAAIVGLWVSYPTQSVALGQLRAIGSHRSVPEITWEPWGSGRHAPTGTSPVLRDTIRGRYDTYLRSFARTVRAYRHTVNVRFGQEMNGMLFPWGAKNPAGAYVGAWRHIVNVFRSEHATNVRWVWSPLATCCLDLARYPGAAYVDVIGFTGFNGGTLLPGWGGRRSFSQIFDTSIQEAISLSKPIEITEVSTAKERGAQWVSAMFADLKRFPQVKAVVWFNVDLRSQRQLDWRIGPGMTSAFAGR